MTAKDSAASVDAVADDYYEVLGLVMLFGYLISRYSVWLPRKWKTNRQKVMVFLLLDMKTICDVVILMLGARISFFSENYDFLSLFFFFFWIYGILVSEI